MKYHKYRQGAKAFHNSHRHSNKDAKHNMSIIKKHMTPTQLKANDLTYYEW